MERIRFVAFLLDQRVTETVAGQFGLFQNVLLKRKQMSLSLGVQVIVVVDVGVQRHRIVGALFRPNFRFAFADDHLGRFASGDARAVL